MAQLPDDVLGRLPSQSLAACRCVSKEWRDFVNGSDELRAGLLPVKVAGMFFLLSATSGFEFFGRPAVGAVGAIPGMLQYLPDDLGDRVRGHCNGIIAFPGLVVNPATRQWTRLPPAPPCSSGISSCLFSEHLVFDPTVSPHYEVFLIPAVPSMSHHSAVFITESEWPPSEFSLRVFGLKTSRWDEMTFRREGECAGTVPDMRLKEENVMLGVGPKHQSVYSESDGALYVSCGGNFFLRISMTSGKYQVIKPPTSIGLLKYAVLYLGKLKKQVCCASMHDRCRLQIWSLRESFGQLEWVLKHQVDFISVLAQCEYGKQTQGPWMVHDDISCEAEEKLEHEPRRTGDSVYDGENDGQCMIITAAIAILVRNTIVNRTTKITTVKYHRNLSGIPTMIMFSTLQMWLILAHVKILNSLDFILVKRLCSCMYHPQEEWPVIWILDRTKLQDLGELEFSDLDFIEHSFV